jgi:hypothetical protein
MTAEQVWDSLLTLTLESPDAKLRPDDEVYLAAFVVEPSMSAKAVLDAARQVQSIRREEGEQKKKRLYKGNELLRASELPQPERDQHFLRMFGQSDRQIADSGSDEGSVPQVLMLMNGEAQNVLRNQKSLVLATAMNQSVAKQQIASLYLSFFSRMPKAEEMEEAEQALQSGLTLSDLTWVLFNTREFIFVQ